MSLNNKVGEERINNQGMKMKIVKYTNAQNIEVEFENGYIANARYQNFKNGEVNHIDFKARKGEVRYNNLKSKITVIDYIANRNILVQFDNGYIMRTRWNDFNSGSVQSPYCKIQCGVGYMGEGKYTTKDIWYKHWTSLFDRVYREGYPSQRWYGDKSVDPIWFNYQNFGAWCEDNYYNFPEKLFLDKDILLKGNKIYSPETCVFVSSNINKMFVKADCVRGDYPIGVHKNNDSYIARCCYVDLENNKAKRKTIGAYDNPTGAFNAYKQFKESHIKQVAEHFKSQIPEKLYAALINYEVEITD